MTAAADAPLTNLLARGISQTGPISFSAYMTAALYDPEFGFFATSGAGRAGAAFLTSPEVGPLFGRLVARALDDHWRALDRPDPFVVIEMGAGRGQLAHTVLRSDLECAVALHYVTVEQSASLRAEQATRFAGAPASPRIRADLAPNEFAHLLFANELLDNLAFDVATRVDDGWRELRVDWSEGFMAVPAVLDPDAVQFLDAMAADAPVGTAMLIPAAFRGWFDAAGRALAPGGRIVIIDYAADTQTLIGRSGAWLRTYRAQGRGGSEFDAPGSQDITSDVWIEALLASACAAGFQSCGEPIPQARWLATLGLDELVEAGRARWDSRGTTDMVALEARSAIAEASALTEADGLGAHLVFTFEKASGTAL